MLLAALIVVSQKGEPPGRPIAWAISPDVQVAATLTIDGSLQMWAVDAKGNAHPTQVVRTESWPASGPGLPDVVSISPKGRYVAVHRPQGGYDIWSVASGRLIDRILGLDVYERRRSAWLPTGDAFLFESETEAARLRHVLDGTTVDFPVGAPWLFTPDRKAVLGLAKGELRLVDLATRRAKRRFLGPLNAESFSPYVLSPDGRLLVGVGDDPHWKGPGNPPEDGAFTESAYVRTLRLNVWRFADGKLLRSLPGFSRISAMRISSDFDSWTVDT